MRKKKQNVEVIVLTTDKTNLSQKDINKFNAQYPNLSIIIVNNFHDRFLIINKTKVYLIGASIKDAGKKCFAIAELEDKNLVMELIKRVKINIATLFNSIKTYVVFPF